MLDEVKRRLGHPLILLAVAVLVTAPWLSIRVLGHADSFAPLSQVALSGLAVLGASFLLAWGAETAEKDVPRAFAIAVLAVLAVAPEYAVDALYAWEAGQTPGPSEAANLAVANMTGANRILIGLGWAGIALFAIYRARTKPAPDVTRKGSAMTDHVELDPRISLEITFLFAATVFAFAVPFFGGIDLLDTVVLVGLYLAYIAVVIRGEVEEHEGAVGVPAYFHERPRWLRIPIAIALFAYAGAMIFIAVEPFAHGLEDLGLQLGIPKFFMIQWMAPLASESPELIVVLYLVNKARSTAAFNTLISSKLNQWTLLIGTLSIVYSLSLGEYGTLAFDAKQAGEIWLTAAQSYFALALLTDLKLSGREALSLLVLFVTQVVAEFVLIRTQPAAIADRWSLWLIHGYSVVYMILGTVLLYRDRHLLGTIFHDAWSTVQDAWGPSTPEP